MGFDERKEHATESSRKGKLSFVLNDGEDDAMTPSQTQDSSLSSHLRGHNYDRSSTRDRNNEIRRRGTPSGFDHSQGPNQSTPLSFSQQSRSGTGQNYLPGSERSIHRLHATSDVPGSEKRGVRKKRQRKFVCDTCEFGFYTNSDLQKHVSSVHLLLRPYECSMCDKKFGERSNATKHFKSVHERQKNAACDICHKVFAFRDGLVRHVRLVHENVRNFHCQYPGCGQSFKQSAHLKKHEQVHNKSRAVHQHGDRGSSSSRKEPGRRNGSSRT